MKLLRQKRVSWYKFNLHLGRKIIFPLTGDGYLKLQCKLYTPKSDRYKMLIFQSLRKFNTQKFSSNATP